MVLGFRPSFFFGGGVTFFVFLWLWGDGNSLTPFRLHPNPIIAPSNYLYDTKIVNVRELYVVSKQDISCIMSDSLSLESLIVADEQVPIPLSIEWLRLKLKLEFSIVWAGMINECWADSRSTLKLSKFDGYKALVGNRNYALWLLQIAFGIVGVASESMSCRYRESQWIAVIGTKFQSRACSITCSRSRISSSLHDSSV